MPLVGLDEIEWDKLNHVYGKAKNIPDLLRAVDEAKSQQEFEKVLGDLWSYIYHQGSIYEATSYTLRFAIQILKNTDVPERKVLLMMCFGETLRDEPAGSIRQRLTTYDAVAGGLDYFLGYLLGDSMELQFASLYVLSCLSEEAEKVMPALVECIQNSSDERLKASAAWVYCKFLNSTFSKSRDLDLTYILEWAENETHPFLLRLAAAFGYLAIRTQLQVLPKVVQIVCQSMKMRDWNAKLSHNRNIDYLCAELMPFPDIALIWSRSEVWIELLKALNPSPTQAHLLVREIMNSTFPRSSHSSWDKSNDWTNQDRLGFWDRYITIQYKPRFQKYVSPLVGQGLGHRHILAIQTIVDCEPFWEIPTNLFSFFYGLPDGREELRKLLEGK